MVDPVKSWSSVQNLLQALVHVSISEALNLDNVPDIKKYTL